MEEGYGLTSMLVNFPKSLELVGLLAHIKQGLFYVHNTRELCIALDPTFFSLSALSRNISVISVGFAQKNL